MLIDEKLPPGHIYPQITLFSVANVNLTDVSSTTHIGSVTVPSAMSSLKSVCSGTRLS